MKFTIPFLIIVCFSCNIAEKDELRFYYSYIQEAENRIIADDLDKAISLYDIAFNIKSPFADDLHNYFIANLKTRNTEGIKKIIEILVSEKGASMDYFISTRIDTLLSNLIERNWLDRNFDLWHEQFVNNSNYELRNQILAMFNKDQQLRDVNLYSSPYLQNIDSISFYDSIHYNKILDLLIKDNRCISEANIGAWYDDKYSFYLPLVTLLLHFHSNGGWFYDDKGYNLMGYVEIMVKNGLLSNDIISDLGWQKDLCLNSDPCIIPGDFPIVEINGKLFEQTLRRYSKLDSLRGIYYMEPFAKLKRKINFQYKNPIYLFNSKSAIVYGDINSFSEQIIITQNNLNLITE